MRKTILTIAMIILVIALVTIPKTAKSAPKIKSIIDPLEDFTLSDTKIIEVVNEGDVITNVIIEAEVVKGDFVKIEPSSTTLMLEPNKPQQVKFTIKNMGATKQQEITIRLILKDMLGRIIETDEESCIMSPYGSYGATYLTVHTLDKETGDPISGAKVIIKYDEQSKFGFTGEVGSLPEAITFELGTYQGDVTVMVDEMIAYEGTVTSTTVKSGYNEVFVYLTPKVRKGRTIDWTLWFITGALISFITIFGLTYYYYKRRTKFRKK